MTRPANHLQIVNKILSQDPEDLGDEEYQQATVHALAAIAESLNKIANRGGLD